MSNKYQRPFAPEETLDEDEQELEANANMPPASQLTPEETTWKKRYGDLRSHTQKQLNTVNAELADLRKKLETTVAQNVQMPTSEAEVEDWVARYPAVANVVQALALRQAKTVNASVEERLAVIAEKEKQNDVQSALIELKKLHPDFESIQNNSAFHDWLEQKSKRLRDSIYENDTDYQAAAETLDLFKLETNFGKAKQPARNANRDNASEIRTRSTTRPASTTEPMFKESQIRAMSGAEFAENEEAIDKAQREGRIEYDMKDIKEAARG